MAAKPSASGMTAGELARAAGVSTDTLRNYERKGLLATAPRGENGYRSYPRETLSRVQLIRRALAIGFTIEELARVLRSRDRGGAPCAEVRRLAVHKMQQLEERLRELVALRDALRETLTEWDARLVKTPAGKRARLLECLPQSVGNGGTRSGPFSTRTQRKEIRR